MEYLSSSRKRPSNNNASSTDDHDSGNKRSRLFDLTSSSPELPSLQQSQTFESTSTTTSSTHYNAHEYYSAISSARHRLTSARIAHTHAVSTLQSAQLEYERTLKELDCAQEYVAGVEERWGVIDLESEEEVGVLNGEEMRRQKRKQQQQMHVQQVDIGTFTATTT